MTTVDLEERPYTGKFSRLVSVNSKLNNALDQIPSLLSIYQFSNGKANVASDIYSTASERIAQLIPFRVGAFFELEEPGGDLKISYVSCSRQRISLILAVERLVEEKVIDWVIERRLPVIIESDGKDEKLLLHALVTATGVGGLFVAVLANNTEQIADCDLSLLSILLYNLANAIELCEREVVAERESMRTEMKSDPGSDSQGHARVIDNSFYFYEKTKQTNTNCHSFMKNIEELPLDKDKYFSVNRKISLDSKLIIDEKIKSVTKIYKSFNELKNPINFIRVNLEFLKNYISDIDNFIENNEFINIKNNKKGYKLDCYNETNNNIIKLFDIHPREDLGSIFLESDNGLAKIDDFINSLGKFYKKSEQDIPIVVDINQIIDDTMIFTQKLFQGEVIFSTDFDNIPLLLGYPVLLKDIFLSLFQRSIVAFDNQPRSTPGFIAVKTWADKQKIWCTINDDGLGVAENDWPPGGSCSHSSLTGEWYLTNATLAIVHDVVVNKHKGEVSVAYPGNRGSVITIQLPVWECENASSDSCYF